MGKMDWSQEGYPSAMKEKGKGSSSEENIAEAFAGESQANRKYLAFAKKAEEEGYPNVAKLFRAAADAETVHATNHLKAMDGIKDTLNNVMEARKGEHYESHQMYKYFIDHAKTEGNARAEKTFTWAIKAEEVHEELYRNAEAALKSKKDMESQEYFTCSVCGYTAVKEAPDNCPVCGARKKSFRKVD